MKKIYILIDDDELVRMTWKFKARAAGVEFHSFSSSKDFFEQAANLPRDAVINIDSKLGEDKKGEEIALDIHKLGFNEIHLATGREGKDLKYDHAVIKSVRGKEPPF
jgi:FixJ family two-component response regulator